MFIRVMKYATTLCKFRPSKNKNYQMTINLVVMCSIVYFGHYKQIQLITLARKITLKRQYNKESARRPCLSLKPGETVQNRRQLSKADFFTLQFSIRKCLIAIKYLAPSICLKALILIVRRPNVAF